MIKEPSLLNKNFNINPQEIVDVESDEVIDETKISNQESQLKQFSKQYSIKLLKVFKNFSKGALIGLVVIAIALSSYYFSLSLFPKPFIEISSIVVNLDKRSTYKKTQKEYVLNTPNHFEIPIEQTELPDVTANSYLIYNPETYQILLDKNSNEHVQIASLTKLMTALIVVDTYDMDQFITLNKPIPVDLEWTLKLNIGDSLTVEDALHAMLMSSYNDMAYLAALNYPNGGYDGFIEEMNIRAQNFGMYDTHYVNSYGFDDPENYSTAKDLAKLLNIFMRNEHLMEIISKGGETISIKSWNGISNQKIIYSTNYLLGRDSRVLGMKTGTTKQAGACFTGYFQMDSQTNYVSIILGSNNDRFQETLDLVQYVEDNFE